MFSINISGVRFITSSTWKSINFKLFFLLHYLFRPTMDKSTTILKFIFVLGIWSFLVLGLLKLNDRNATFSDHFPITSMSRRFLLQRDNHYFEATSTTSDGTLDDVLVDNRQGKIIVRFSAGDFRNFINLHI